MGKTKNGEEGQQNSEMNFANQDLRLDLQNVTRTAKEMELLFLGDGTPNMAYINDGGKIIN